MNVECHGLGEQLTAMSLGELEPGEAGRAVREALRATPSLSEDVYAALRDVVWRTVSSREFGSDLNRWFHVVEYAGTGLRAVGKDAVAERVDVLADLLHQSAAFARRQPLEQVLARKHVGAILGHLAEQRGAYRREELRHKVGLSDPNLSRVLALLESHGLVKRERSGKEKLLELTGAGQAAARSPLSQVAAMTIPEGESPSAIEHLPFPIACWDANGRLKSANAAARELADAAGDKSELEELDRWRASVEAASAGVRGEAGSETWLLRLGEDRWSDVTFSGSEGSDTTFFAVDVSHRQDREAELLAEVQALREGLERAKKQVAELKERSFAYARSAVRVRDVLSSALSVTGDDAGQHFVTRHAAATVSKTSGEKVEAFRHLMREFLAPPEATEPSLHVDVVTYVEQMVSSMKTIGCGITSELHDFKGVRVPTVTARRVVNQLVFGATKAGSIPAGHLTATRDHDGLILHLKTSKNAISPALFTVGAGTEANDFGPMSVRSYALETSDDFIGQTGVDAEEAEIAMFMSLRAYEAP
ncbi:winged helix-turn-helix domain-containing protein [Acidisphaera sp. S103]|uniref:helix-turn-helix transcriptional regulator n=1 Tax=Acidisphaera sp. S103 TaxID=1747223 RepID=UPI00131C7F31|nr:winged helix-turn-helix domain-containing protein [Acidisphaera sp. S103]